MIEECVRDVCLEVLLLSCLFMDGECRGSLLSSLLGNYLSFRAVGAVEVCIS